MVKLSYFREKKMHSALWLLEAANFSESKMGDFALKSNREDVTLNGTVKIDGVLGLVQDVEMSCCLSGFGHL